MTTESIIWIKAADALPDAETNVLCFDEESMAVLRWSATAAEGNCARSGIDAAEVSAMSIRSSASRSQRARNAVVETVESAKSRTPRTARSAALRGSAAIAGQLPE